MLTRRGASPVDRAESVLPQRCFVLLRRVPMIFVEAILRVLAVQFLHQLVKGHLRPKQEQPRARHRAIILYSTTLQLELIDMQPCM